VKFKQQLQKEIDALKKKAKAKGMIPAVRLNGTSDIQWENFGIIQDNPDIQFYDYQKIPSALRKNLPPNYHLTYSYTGQEISKKFSEQWAERGVNTAVVFRGGMPKEFLGRPVINGDESDARFLDPKGVIVGLHAKGAALKGISSFIQDTKPEDVAIPYISGRDKTIITKKATKEAATTGQDVETIIKRMLAEFHSKKSSQAPEIKPDFE
jgi:hypothetical protein